MIVSNCCHARVFVVSGNEGTSYYACTKCDNACDGICPIVPFDVPRETLEVENAKPAA